MENTKWLLGVIIVLSLTILALMGWEITYGSLSNEKVAWVGDQTVTKAELEEMLTERHGKQTLDEMVNALVIDQEAQKLGITVTPEELDQEISQMKEGYRSEEEFVRSVEDELGMKFEDLKRDIRLNLLLEKLATQDVYISDAEAEAYYDAHEELYFKPESVHLLQIIVATEEEANETVNELKDGADFSTLAKERSKDVLSASNGGDLGFVNLDDPYVPFEILEVAADLNDNEVSQVIALENEYAIIKIVEREPSSKVPFEHVRNDIIREMALSQVQALTEVLKQLRVKYDVQTVDLLSH
jgi:foldase protein PrsA